MNLNEKPVTGVNKSLLNDVHNENNQNQKESIQIGRTSTAILFATPFNNLHNCHCHRCAMNKWAAFGNQLLILWFIFFSFIRSFVPHSPLSPLALWHIFLCLKLACDNYNKMRFAQGKKTTISKAAIKNNTRLYASTVMFALKKKCFDWNLHD